MRAVSDEGRGTGSPRQRAPPVIHLRDSSLAGNNQEWNIWGRTMAGGRPPALFTCPQCAALYQVLKVEARLETAEKKITCQICGAPLVGREEKFVLKYFLLRKAIRRQRHHTLKAN
jgi:hypothetical protein